LAASVFDEAIDVISRKDTQEKTLAAKAPPVAPANGKILHCVAPSGNAVKDFSSRKQGLSRFV
jgi:hypothetical protein